MKDIDPSLYKLPPQNIEAEQSILGSILLENGTINAVQEILNRDDFYSEAHRKIFSAIERMADKNEPVDLITLSSALKDQNLLDSIGGAAYLASLVDNVPTAANAANYAKIVKGKSVLRGLIHRMISQ
ncbi:MAG: Replicative DNA helicase [bacterium ADurb.Bin478]|nr:MAG: Replicative DNA helicase [bacterium ADurb.Bin478]